MKLHKFFKYFARFLCCLEWARGRAWPGMKLLDGNLDYSEEETKPQYTCEFWINNFQFAVYFDLERHVSIPAEDPEETSPDLLENFQAEDGGGLHVNDLPTEMLSKIFSFCRAIDLLAVQAVCRHWQDIVQSDQGLWNHIHFSAIDLDVRTTVSLLKEMPLIGSVELCNVHSSEDMNLIVSALCDACWQLHQVHFPESCDWHPSPQDLHHLSYYHPRIRSLHLCTKQKLTATELLGLGVELSRFPYLQTLKLVGFYWHQPELVSTVLFEIENIVTLILPSVPGLTGTELVELAKAQPNLRSLTLNTSSLSANNLKFTCFHKLTDLRIIDNTVLTAGKVNAISTLKNVTSLEINLNNCSKDVLAMFSIPRNCLTQICISNCGFSDELVGQISIFCTALRRIVWHNPKDSQGELTDAGLFAMTKLPLLNFLEVKSRSLTKSHYPDLAQMRSLHYVRINGMRVPGCS